jgi:CBS domain-containing protein
LAVKAKDVMTCPDIVVHKDASLAEVARVMLEHGLSTVPVVDGAGRLCGAIAEAAFTGEVRRVAFSDQGLLRLFGRWADPRNVDELYRVGRLVPAHEVMQPFGVTVREGDDLTRVLERMHQHHLTCIPVVRDGAVVGVITQHDLLRLMARDASDRRATASEECAHAARAEAAIP